MLSMDMAAICPHHLDPLNKYGGIKGYRLAASNPGELRLLWLPLKNQELDRPLKIHTGTQVKMTVNSLSQHKSRQDAGFPDTTRCTKPGYEDPLQQQVYNASMLPWDHL